MSCWRFGLFWCTVQSFFFHFLWHLIGKYWLKSKQNNQKHEQDITKTKSLRTLLLGNHKEKVCSGREILIKYAVLFTCAGIIRAYSIGKDNTILHTSCQGFYTIFHEMNSNYLNLEMSEIKTDSILSDYHFIGRDPIVWGC